MNIVIAGGGTGGHLFPCIALAHTFMKQESQTKILFIGTGVGMEARIVPTHGFLFQPIAAAGFVGKPFFGKMRALSLIFVGIFQAISHLIRFSPDLVIGIGGYASCPVMLAAFFLRMKRVILEPNLIPGMMNQIVAPFVHLAVTAFHETKTLLRTKKIVCLGVPVRAEILDAATTLLKKEQTTQKKTLLILGGSQGAQSLNQAIISALPVLKEMPIQLIHQTGEKEAAEVSAAYKQCGVNGEVFPFIEKMSEVYLKADFVLSRAGAGTLSELAMMGLPALLVPFPGAKGHQQKNAESFVKAGAAEIILNHDLTCETLVAKIKAILSDPEKCSNMAKAARTLAHPNAANDIVSACFSLVRGDTATAAGNP
ncbi:MAG: undecaprenyldiphospho-muramoylpentapeptide beta-N-acetylglucosaminyltransferase [Nitrospirota bacterium]